MSRRLTLTELRELALEELYPHVWRTPSEIADGLGLSHGLDYYRVALVCERLAHEGLVELANPSSRGKRRFRRSAAA